MAPIAPGFGKDPPGGGSLSDLMCHSVEANRYLLSPADDKDYLRPVAVNASIASLKWSLPK